MFFRNAIACFSNSGFQVLRIPKLIMFCLSLYNCPELFYRIQLKRTRRKVDTSVTSAFNQSGKFIVLPIDMLITQIV